MSITPTMRTGIKLCALSTASGSSGRNRSTYKMKGTEGFDEKTTEMWAESGANKGWRAPCQKLLPPST